MLLVEDLQVELAGKTILQHIDLEIKPGETHVLFGPNGSGKTSLLMTLMGYPQYQVVAGKIVFKGVDITYAPIDERARLGIGTSYPHVRTRQPHQRIHSRRRSRLPETSRQVALPERCGGAEKRLTPPDRSL